MSDKETLLNELHALELHHAQVRQECDWEEASRTSEAIAKVEKDLKLDADRAKQETAVQPAKAPIGMTSEQMKHILMP